MSEIARHYCHASNTQDAPAGPHRSNVEPFQEAFEPARGQFNSIPGLCQRTSLGAGTSAWAVKRVMLDSRCRTGGAVLLAASPVVITVGMAEMVPAAPARRSAGRQVGPITRQQRAHRIHGIH